MTAKMRDSDIFNQIIEWCSQLKEAHEQFNHSFDSFNSNSIYRNAVSMCLLQIGELSKQLSAEFRETHSELPWHEIIGMRNHFAHVYGQMDLASIWETAICDIPNVEKFCKEHIS